MAKSQRVPGKKIGGRVYVARDYEDVLPGVALAKARLLPYVLSMYDVVCWHQRSNRFSFVECPGFDTEDEPVIGRIWSVHPESPGMSLREPPADPYIYHHKWKFVADDYPGFDVAASKRRSDAWSTLPGVDKSRIGKLSYWQEHVVPRIPKVDDCDSNGRHQIFLNAMGNVREALRIMEGIRNPDRRRREVEQVATLLKAALGDHLDRDCAPALDTLLEHYFS